MKLKTYLIDLDGTMYQGTNIIDGAKDFIDYLIATKHPFYFFTNNSSRTREEAAKHMLDVGYENISPEMFYTSAIAAAHYVAQKYEGRRAYYIGMNGMKEALEEEGFEIVDHDADFVFIGLDKQGQWDKYSKALRELVNGATLIGTNNDRILLQENGANIGNGSVVAMFEYAIGKESERIGKPSPVSMNVFCDLMHVDKKECVIIGDNLETDILCGVNSDVDTIFVTTGVHKEKDIERLGIHPTRIIKNLRELIGE